MKALGGKSIALFSQRISYAACFSADFFSFRNFIHCFLPRGEGRISRCKDSGIYILDSKWLYLLEKKAKREDIYIYIYIYIYISGRKKIIK